jgi:alkanesulfonate monooxygenase SsuD/methylene tetrahydromethanopterin reductase-like flavin-dependent oxidoreductase (luciferase family)
MRFAFVVPMASEPEFVELAVLGEQHGWDMVFTWEAAYRCDAWATLAAAAMCTDTIRLGTLITPAARYRPWDLTQRVASVDRLSGGRVTLGVGLRRDQRQLARRRGRRGPAGARRKARRVPRHLCRTPRR